jgi:uncharacterized protein (TIRG00374 family)
MIARATAFRLALFLSGLAIGGVLLWLVLGSIDWQIAKRAFAATDPHWVALGVASFAVALALRSWRWHRLVLPLGPASFSGVSEALIVGYAINNIVPARLGELYRADRLARRTGLSRSAILGTIFLERLLDLILVTSLLGAGFVAVTRESTAIGATLASAAALIALSLAVLATGLWLGRSPLLPWMQERMTAPASFSQRAVRQVLGVVERFSRTLSTLYAPQFILVALATLPIWAIESFAIMAVLRAVGIDIGVAGLMLTIAAGSLSTLVPSAPGFLGSYQFAYIVALGLLGIDHTLAAVAATSVVIYLIGSVTLVGLLLLGATSLRGLFVKASA